MTATNTKAGSQARLYQLTQTESCPGDMMGGLFKRPPLVC